MFEISGDQVLETKRAKPRTPISNIEIGGAGVPRPGLHLRNVEHFLKGLFTFTCKILCLSLLYQMASANSPPAPSFFAFCAFFLGISVLYPMHEPRHERL